MAKTTANRDPRVDAYIAKQAPFAQPILTHLRELFHKASPQINEEIKWGVPHFTYKGIVGGVAAFKHHVGFGFWKSKLMQDPAGLFRADPKASMCTAKFTSIDELPKDKILLSYIREAVALNENEVKVPAVKKARPALKAPTYLTKALQADPVASANFASFSPSHRRDYIEWLLDAKTEATRHKRLATTLEWLRAGKHRNWKYERSVAASRKPSKQVATRKSRSN